MKYKEITGSPERDNNTKLGDQLKSTNLSPEDVVLGKEANTNLSREAKIVLGLIFNCPTDFMNLIKTPTTGKVSVRAREKLEKYLRQELWKGVEGVRGLVKNVMKELETYNKQM